MIKQVVTETWTSVNNVKFTTSDKFDSDLIGKKEYQEVITPTINGRIVKYWVWVSKELTPKQKAEAKERLKELEKNVEIAKKNKIQDQKLEKQANHRVENKSTAERVAMYKQIVANGGTLMGCDKENWWES